MPNSCISWNREQAHENSMCMFLIIPTCLCHILFWIQVCSYKTLRHCSLIWIYNYLVLDLISLFQVLLEYITRRSNLCGLNPFWHNLLCVLEAYTNDYTTMVQSFALVLINIYRYRLIVKRKAISIHSIFPIISIHLLMYSLPFIIFILQYLFTSTTIIDVPGLSCDVEFSPWYIQFINILFVIILPTCITVPVVFMIIQHARLSQNTIQSVRRIHRYLIIQSVILYSIWFLFFIPEVVFMFPLVAPDSQSWITKVLNTIAALFDPLVITSFDRRFIEAWKKSICRIRVFLRLLVHRRIHPIQDIQLVAIR